MPDSPLINSASLYPMDFARFSEICKDWGVGSPVVGSYRFPSSCSRMTTSIPVKDRHSLGTFLVIMNGQQLQGR